ncbi:MAG TPA: cell wall hydrolase [Rhizomicrobium sp.]|jgi:spore germination cell wall hydrolase CwlJ-like protein|nr:cell wall hydrolase [Rhizomicrobium sp.]
MPTKTNDAISRSDRVLVAALGIILATASAAIGASLTYHPSTDKVVLPRPAVQQVAEAPAPAVTDVVMTQLLAEHKCLSEVLYYEARGEGLSGQKAIAEVVFHRMNHGDYGHSICAVVYEGKDKPGCQFSFACNGDVRRPKQMAAWRQSEKLAAAILTGQVALKNATGGALNFHAISVTPDWADTLEKTTQIGNHIFYRNGSHSRDS